MLELFPLTDTDVRKLGGRNLYERAIGALSSGKIVDRRAFKNGILTGKWDARSEAPLAAVILSEDEIELEIGRAHV